jgi:hypothetical protein
MSFSEHFSQLVSLQWFDPEAFKEDSEVSRDVCGFVLSLSLIYNDIKNTALLNRVLNESRPPEPITESKDWGEFSALENFIDRMTIGILHELFNLIKHTNKTLDDKYFKSVIKSIPKDFREYWQAIVETSFEGYSNNKLTKDLMVIRINIFLKIISPKIKHIFPEGEICRNQDFILQMPLHRVVSNRYLRMLVFLIVL